MATAQNVSFDALKPISRELYRSLFGTVPTPVAVVTTARPGRPHGTTVSAFSALSLDPPLVLVSLDRHSELLRAVRSSRGFLVNVLASDQEHLAVRFARKASDKFDGVRWLDHHGFPRIIGCQSWLAARVRRVVSAGDHMIVIGLVVDGRAHERTPLLYHRRRFHVLPPAATEAGNGKEAA